MSKAEKTREYIIKKSAAVFNKKGYAGTSLNDIIKATGLTKGAIYGNFKNKDEVAIAVYKYNVTLLNKQLDAALSTEKSLTDKLIAFTEYYRVNWKKIYGKGGCPILNASVEADDNLPFLKKSVQESIKLWMRRISGIIEEGKHKGEFKKDIIAKEYAYTIIMLIEGGILLSKILNNEKRLLSALSRVRLIVNQEIIK